MFEATKKVDPNNLKVDYKDFYSLSRMLKNELDIIDNNNKILAVVLIYLCLNIAEKNNMSVNRLLTGVDGETIHWPQKNKGLLDGRISIFEMGKEPDVYYPVIIEDCMLGKIKDPTYGATSFFNVLEEDCPEYYRNMWGVGEFDQLKTGLLFWPYELDPIPFLKARAEGKLSEEEEFCWLNMKKLYW